jgi:hypothetical protein
LDFEIPGIFIRSTLWQWVGADVMPFGDDTGSVVFCAVSSVSFSRNMFHVHVSNEPETYYTAKTDFSEVKFSVLSIFEEKF